MRVVTVNRKHATLVITLKLYMPHDSLLVIVRFVVTVNRKHATLVICLMAVY